MGPHQPGTALNERHQRNLAFARLFSSAVLSQALLSAASFAVGLILLRSATVLQYGFYVLAVNAILLLVSLQNAFFGPPLAIRMQQIDRQERARLAGGLYRGQRRIASVLGILAILVAAGLWYARVLEVRTALLILATAAAAMAILHREYFRVVLLAHRRPHEVLRTDVVYIAVLMAGVLIATLTQQPAIAAICALGVAAITGGLLLSRALQQHEPIDSRAAPGLLRSIAPLAAWSTAGAAIHWTFSQGYIYLVAGMLDVTAVAAIAATRLLMMPLNLLSTGIGSLMLPVASGWLYRHGAPLLLRRLYLLAAGMVVAALCYFSVVWLLRDWIFANVLEKQFMQRDQLLLLWGAIFLVMVVRDQLVYRLAAEGRFRTLTLLTLLSAIVSLSTSYWGMLQFGSTGALVGILTGEVISLVGVIILSNSRGPSARSSAVH